MPFSKLSKTDDGRDWYVGNSCSWSPEVTVPIDQIDGLSDAEIGSKVRSLMRHAKICDTVSYESRIGECNIEFIQETIELLSEVDNDPEYDYQDVHDVLRWAKEGLIRKQEEERKRQEKQQRLAEQEARRNRIEPGFVYVIKSPTGEYKIGRAKNLNQRMDTFEVKMPFDVEIVHVISSERYRLAEKHLHSLYADKRIKGEWFALDESDIAEIKAIKAM